MEWTSKMNIYLVLGAYSISSVLKIQFIFSSAIFGFHISFSNLCILADQSMLESDCALLT